MKTTSKKRADARRRATCVRELRRWRRCKHPRPTASQVVIDLQARYPDLPMSKRSLFRWDRLAGERLSIDALCDSRGGPRIWGFTLEAASTTRRWWLDRGSSIRPTKAESRIVDRLDTDDEARHFAQHRLRVARAVLDLQRRAGLPINTAARHLIDCLRSAEPGVRVSRGAAVAWARRYADQGSESVARMIYRRPAGSPWRAPK